MSKHYLEIENFSPSEVTEMFDAICKDVVKKSPIEVKKELLGIKNAKSDTKVSLSHLMLLMEANKVDFTFRVTYEKDDKEIPVSETPNLTIGLKEDPIHTEMQKQSEEIKSDDNFEKGKNPVFEPIQTEKLLQKFDPNNIPNFDK